MKSAIRASLILAALGLLAAVPGFATTVIVDEFTGSCNTTTGCTVILPFAPVTGQVLLTDSDAGGITLDVVTFDSTSSSYTFASDNVDGFDAPADTFGPPAIQPNVVSLEEPVNEGGPEIVLYTPTSGQPGYALDSSGQPITYSFNSGSPVVPEPATIFLLGSGIVAVFVRRGNRSSTTS